MKPTIEILVSPTGDIKIDAVGFKGSDCEQATKYLEEALGMVSTRSKKPEYHTKTTTKAKQRLGR